MEQPVSGTLIDEATNDLNAEIFVENLLVFLNEGGISTKKIMTAMFHKTNSDIYRLHLLVKKYGGFYYANYKKLWSLILDEMILHPNVMPVNVRNFYKKFVLPFIEANGEITGVENVQAELNGKESVLSPNGVTKEKMSIAKSKLASKTFKRAKTRRSDDVNPQEPVERSNVFEPSEASDSNQGFVYGDQQLLMATPFNGFQPFFQPFNGFPPKTHAAASSVQESDQFSSSPSSTMMQNSDFFQPPPMMFAPQFGAPFGFPFTPSPFPNCFPSNAQRFGFSYFPFVFPNPGQYFNPMQQNFAPFVDLTTPSATKQRKLNRSVNDDGDEENS